MRHIFTIKSGIEKEPLAYPFFRMRKRLFVDQMNWNIPHNQEIERDQYDREDTEYVVIKWGHKIVAGARILCTAERGQYWSYMIKDASEGKIAQIPSMLCKNPPVSKDVYEVTRFTVSPEFSREERLRALEELAHATYERVVELGGTNIIAFMNPFYLRWFKKIGFQCSQIGPIVKCGRENYCAIMGPAVSKRALS